MESIYWKNHSIGDGGGRRMIRVPFLLLLIGSGLLNVFLVVFGHSELFPLDVFDSVFFFILAVALALYRPGWVFLLLLSVLPFEVLNLAPSALGISIRPYQVLSLTLVFALVFRFFQNRLFFALTSFRWFDVFPILFVVGGFVSAFVSDQSLVALRQVAIVASFVVMYFLARQFLNGTNDMRKVVPFVSFSAIVAIFFALWQSIRFTSGYESFEVMPGRPNAFFPEPDWFGMFLIFSGSLALALLFFFFEKWRQKNRLQEVDDTCVMNQAVEHAIMENHTKYSEVHCEEKELRVMERVFVCLRHTWENFSRERFFLVTSFFFLMISIVGFIVAVARSAWIGFAISLLIFLKMILVGFSGTDVFRAHTWMWKKFFIGLGTVLTACVFALLFVISFRLTTFDLFDRAGSAVSAFQKITVSCTIPVSLPQRIVHVDELSAFDCRHILLEEVEIEKMAGKFIATVERPDPSIEVRRDIRDKTREALKEHWFFGIGWGNIGGILGKDTSGVTLNASNAFLEVWLGGGMLSLLSFLVIWLCIPVFLFRKIFLETFDEKTLEMQAIILFYAISWAGFTFFNCFNSGILLGFVWIWIGGIGMISGKKM